MKENIKTETGMGGEQRSFRMEIDLKGFMKMVKLLLASNIIKTVTYSFAPPKF